MENDSDENSGSCNLPANKTIELSIGRRKDRDFDTGDSNGDESKKGNQRGLGVVETSSPRLCSPYTDDIFKFYHLIEDDEKWKPNMENIQKSIDVQTRVTEINQLIEKVGSLGYDIRTLCLAVSLMDRVLSAKSVSMDKIQLLLLACLLIAAKYQGFTPHSEDFITALHNAEKVVTMEEEVLDCLQFDVWTPTAMAFVGKYITAAQMHDESVLRCYQLIKLTLLDHICIKFKPSIVAASVVYVAKILMNPTKHPWDSHMQSNSGIHLANLKECVERIQWLCNHKDSDADKVEFLVSIPTKFFEFDSVCGRGWRTIPEIRRKGPQNQFKNKWKKSRHESRKLKD